MGGCMSIKKREEISPPFSIWRVDGTFAPPKKPFPIPDALFKGEKADPFSVLPYDLCMRIVEQLDMADVARMSQVSKVWNYYGSENNMWRRLFAQRFPPLSGYESQYYGSNPTKLLEAAKHMPGMDVGNLTFKEKYRLAYAKHTCVKCAKQFRFCSNSSSACRTHNGRREFMENNSPQPTGVYWTCCYQRDFDSPGCQASSPHVPVQEANRTAATQSTPSAPADNTAVEVAVIPQPPASIASVSSSSSDLSSGDKDDDLDLGQPAHVTPLVIDVAA